MSLIKLPGLIDTHVHLREPGATQKEDFETGTKAAIAGGYTTVLDMPNNPEPTISLEALENKLSLASKKIYSDVGFHFGATRQSISHFLTVSDKVFGLKVYMNHTTGPLLVEDLADLEAIFEAWSKDKVIMVHAEKETLLKAIELAKKFGNRLHVCHVATKFELQAIQKAKDQGLKLSCEVGMHHLYLTEADLGRLGGFGRMRPPLATQEDQDYLWENIGDIDIIASDHAPHTKEEKEGETVVNGVPGLETSLPLLINSMNQGKISLERIIEMTSTAPRRIFNIPEQKNTYVEVNPEQSYTIQGQNLYTKCGWSPFEGMEVKGKIKRVVLRGNKVFEDGKFLGGPEGKVIYPEK